MATPKFVLVHWLSDPKPDCWQVIQTSCIKAKEVEVGNTYDTEWDPKEETSPATILKLGDSKAYLKQIRLHEYVEPWKQTPIGEKRKHAPKKLPDDFITERAGKDVHRSTSSAVALPEDVPQYGKISRTIGMALGWKEVSPGIWIDNMALNASLKSSTTKTQFARHLLDKFFPQTLRGSRLQDLDKDIVEAIVDKQQVRRSVKKRSAQEQATAPQGPQEVQDQVSSEDDE
ncbi:hypothetical protein QZH41_000512 [Actinostola sp. cb2023]|nr:hypothetical protein QZH41_000512 [Actinostola sp. cb2023]